MIAFVCYSLIIIKKAPRGRDAVTVCLPSVSVRTHYTVSISDLSISVFFGEIEAETPAIVKFDKT